MGFTKFGDKTVCAGLKNSSKIYLALWNLNGEKEMLVPITETVTDVKIAYPTKISVQLDLCEDGILLTCAVFLEISI